MDLFNSKIGQAANEITEMEGILSATNLENIWKRHAKTVSKEEASEICSVALGISLDWPLSLRLECLLTAFSLLRAEGMRGIAVFRDLKAEHRSVFAILHAVEKMVALARELSE